MKNEIRHLGVVDTVDVGLIKVRITQTSACSSCKMSGNCNASESKEKVVDVYCDNHYGLRTGDTVIVIASQRTGFLAVLLSSVIPLIILVAVLAIAFELSQTASRTLSPASGDSRRISITKRSNPRTSPTTARSIRELSST